MLKCKLHYHTDLPGFKQPVLLVKRKGISNSVSFMPVEIILIIITINAMLNTEKNISLLIKNYVPLCIH